MFFGCWRCDGYDWSVQYFQLHANFNQGSSRLLLILFGECLSQHALGNVLTSMITLIYGLNHRLNDLRIFFFLLESMCAPLGFRFSAKNPDSPCGVSAKNPAARALFPVGINVRNTGCRVFCEEF